MPLGERGDGSMYKVNSLCTTALGESGGGGGVVPSHVHITHNIQDTEYRIQAKLKYTKITNVPLLYIAPGLHDFFL